MDGGTEREGRLELCLGLIWGTVAGDKWREDNSEFVCNALGFEYNGEVARTSLDNNKT